MPKITHRPRKRFGQNFLENQHVIQSILQSLHLQASDNVLEIGPGLGALTKPLLNILTKLTAIEIDTDLHAHLIAMPVSQDKLTVICADALTINYNELPINTRIIGNLPYNISTPLLLRLLAGLDSIEDMHFMLQKEVVDRLSASPGCKAYGRLSVMAQYYCDVESLFDVAAESFRPVPRVESSVVRLTPWRPGKYPEVAFNDLERVVACAFSMRRKTLANNLKPWCAAQKLQEIGIDPGLRPEQLQILDYVHLTQALGYLSLQHM